MPPEPGPDLTGAGGPSPSVAPSQEAQPALRTAIEREKTPTEKYRAVQRDKFALHHGVAPNTEDRYGNPLFRNQQQPSTQQAYYHDGYGHLIPMGGPGNQDGYQAPPKGAQHYPAQEASPPQGTMYPQQQAPRSFGLPPPNMQQYTGDPFGPQGAFAKPPLTLSGCLIGPIIPSLLSAGFVVTVERIFKSRPQQGSFSVNQIPPFDYRRLGMFTGGACAFFWMKCPLKVARGYSTPWDSFIAAGTVGALGVNNGILNVPGFGQREIAALMQRHTWVRPAHLGFLSWGAAGLILDSIFGLP